MESALQALVRALTDGAAGPAGQELARKLVQFVESGGRGGVPQSLRTKLGQVLADDPDTVCALGAAMEKLRPGSAALVGGDHIDFDGLFLGDVTGAVLHQHFQLAPAPAEPQPIAVGALPPATPSFTGRKRLLKQLDDFLRPLDGPPQPGTVTATVLAGLAGVGKTALATEAAHAAKDKGWFPGGFLFIDLHGYDHTTVAAEQALGTLLEDLGVRAEQLTTEEQRVKHYRYQLDRWPDRVLIFADNAASPEQVRPLLPADSRHRILITSRTAIPQLGSQHLTLGQLSPEVAVALLDQALRLANGTDLRITAEADAATELARLCGYLPLALQIAAAQLVWDPHKPVAEAVDELRRTGLAFLRDEERSVRAAFELSYRRLTGEQARLLRLLAEAPGPETGADVLAALLGDAPRAGVLAALERAYLVDRSSSRTEWRLHDLVRVFAAQVSAEDPGCAVERGDARERVLRHYLGRADEADNHLRESAGDLGCFAGPEEALGWLDKERLGLLAAVEWGEADRFTARALDLALCLTEYLRRRGLLEEVVAVNRQAQGYASRLGDRLREATAWQNVGDALQSSRPVEAIEAFGRAGDLHRERGDRAGEAAQWNNMAIAESLLGRLDPAIESFGRARELRRMTGDRHGEAMTWNNLAVVLREAGRVEEALEAFTEAAELLEALGDRARASETFRNLGKALEAAGRDGEAVTAFARGRAALSA